MDLAVYISEIKIDADGYRASQEHYKMRYHVNMKFNKNTHN